LLKNVWAKQDSQGWAVALNF